MNAAPRLSVGLPVFNGEKFIAESLEALLGQSYTNFELIIADNASTDDTGDICRTYAKDDSRIRYHRHPQNLGLAPNHNFVVQQARGELFKWAANDDLYASTLLARCIEALDEYPDVVLAHSWTAKINSAGEVTKAFEYPMLTSSTSAPVRFRSILFDGGGDDDYGVMRIEVLRRTAMKGSYHHADRTIIAELGLHGRFYQVPEWLYFRRVHPAQSGMIDHAEAVLEHGSAARKSAAAPDHAPVRRVRVGVHRRDPAGAAVAGGTTEVLSVPDSVVLKQDISGPQRANRAGLHRSAADDLG